MKKMNINIYKVKSLIIISLSGIVLSTFTGCATRKGPQQVWASPVQRVVSPLNQAVTDAPRTQPGRIMDPDALTYAQVPSRIIYMPGGHDIKSRKSPRQEVAYNLVPVSRIGAIQAQTTPEFGEIIVQDKTTNIEDVVEMTIFSKEGETLRGKGRRLGVLNQSKAEESRARDLLKKGEDLHWDKTKGWVGFVVEKRAKPYSPKNVDSEPGIKPVEDTPKREETKIESIDSSTESDLEVLEKVQESETDEEIELSFD